MTLKDIYCEDDVALIEEALHTLDDVLDSEMGEFSGDSEEYQEAKAKRLVIDKLLKDCK